MEKTIESGGRKYLVKDGVVYATKIDDGSPIEIKGVGMSEIPAHLKKHFSEKGVNVEGKVCFGTAILPRVVAEEAVAQNIEIKKEQQERFAKMFPGYDELISAINDENRYTREFDHMMDDEDNDGVNPPHPIKRSSSDVAKQYPAASAYHKAECWEMSSNYIKSGIGTRGKKAMLSGENYHLVVESMEKEWTDYCNQHVFD